jgi:hypothetical protein
MPDQTDKNPIVPSDPSAELSLEAAQEHLDRLLDYYDLDPSDSDEVAKIIERLKRKLPKHFALGNLELEQDDRGRLFIILNLRCKIPKLDRLKFKPLNGRAKVAMKGFAEDDTYGKVYGLLANLAGVSLADMQKIEGPDIGILDELFALFLAV